MVLRMTPKMAHDLVMFKSPRHEHEMDLFDGRLMVIRLVTPKSKALFLSSAYSVARATI